MKKESTQTGILTNKPGSLARQSTMGWVQEFKQSNLTMLTANAMEMKGLHLTLDFEYGADDEGASAVRSLVPYVSRGELARLGRLGMLEPDPEDAEDAGTSASFAEKLAATQTFDAAVVVATFDGFLDLERSVEAGAEAEARASKKEAREKQAERFAEAAAAFGAALSGVLAKAVDSVHASGGDVVHMGHDGVVCVFPLSGGGDERTRETRLDGRDKKGQESGKISEKSAAAAAPRGARSRSSRRLFGGARAVAGGRAGRRREPRAPVARPARVLPGHARDGRGVAPAQPHGHGPPAGPLRVHDALRGEREPGGGGVRQHGVRRDFDERASAREGRVRAVAAHPRARRAGERPRVHRRRDLVQQPERLDQCVAAGMNEVIVKPATMSSLRLMFRRAKRRAREMKMQDAMRQHSFSSTESGGRRVPAELGERPGDGNARRRKAGQGVGGQPVLAERTAVEETSEAETQRRRRERGASAPAGRTKTRARAWRRRRQCQPGGRAAEPRRRPTPQPRGVRPDAGPE